MSFPRLEHLPQLLRDHTDPQTYERGEGYFIEGLAVDIAFKTTKRGEHRIVGTVYGSKKYETELTVNPGVTALTDFSCTCPLDDQTVCKHIVALGLAAVMVPSGTKEENDARMQRVLRQFIDRKQLKVSARDQAELITALKALGVEAGARGIQPPVQKVAHELEAIHMALRYEPATDEIHLAVSGAYGPVSVPLLVEDPDNTYGVRRDRFSEGACARVLRNAGVLQDASSPPGEYLVKGEENIFWFLKDTLAELQDQYVVTMDDSMEPLQDIGMESVDSQWKMETSGQDFFEFSVDWHCGKAKVSVDQLEQMARAKKPYIRLKDGSFVECENPEEVTRLLEMIRRAQTVDGARFKARLFDAPEMMEALQRGNHARRTQMSKAFAAFVAQAKTGTPITPVTLPASLEDVLRPYQKEGVAWIAFLREHRLGGVLADEMGLGKTLQVLASLVASKTAGKAPTLVVCPKTLTHVWAQEAARYTPELSVIVIEGSPAERRKRLKKAFKHDLVITSYPMLQRDLLQYVHVPTPFAACILDEAQYIKNAKTTTAKSAKLIPAEHRLALTGTPLENGLHELWAVFDFLMPGFLGNAREFRARFAKPIQAQNAEALEALKSKIAPFMLRRTKQSELKELPAKIEEFRSCPLSPEQLVIYTRTLNEVREDVFRSVAARGFNRSRIEILSALTKLRRICDHPVLADPRLPRTEAVSGKLEHVIELVREAVDGGHKILLFSQFTSMLDLVREALDRHEIGHVTIEGKTRNRGEVIKRFAKEKDTHVFLLSLKAGGTGLTLTEADTVILVDPWWNPMAERQAMDRAHRIGQTKTVNVYKLVTTGTIEEKVVALQAKKQQVFDAIMSETGESMEALTWEDVQSLFA